MSKTAPADYATRRWNPTTGCSPVSAGCASCWARRFAKRHAGRFGYPKDAPFTPTCHPDRLDEPLRWRKPQTVAVSFMGDLFHEAIPADFILKVLSVIGHCSSEWYRCYAKDCDHDFCDENTLHPMDPHRFLVLTKRPERVMSLLSSDNLHDRICEAWSYSTGWHFANPPILGATMPFPNLYLGVSVEDQRSADERIPILLNIPAVHRWVSVEPQIGPVDLAPYLVEPGCPSRCQRPEARTRYSTDPGYWVDLSCRGRPDNACDDWKSGRLHRPRIDWVVQGCESGPGRRPFDIAWARSMRDQCAAAGVPYYLKQIPVEECQKDGENWTAFARCRGCDLPLHRAEQSGPYSCRHPAVQKQPFLDGHQHLALPWEVAP